MRRDASSIKVVSVGFMYLVTGDMLSRMWCRAGSPRPDLEEASQ
jgi:hypothetical protein